MKTTFLISRFWILSKTDSSLSFEDAVCEVGVVVEELPGECKNMKTKSVKIVLKDSNWFKWNYLNVLNDSPRNQNGLGLSCLRTTSGARWPNG